MREWAGRQWAVAGVGAALIAVVLGVATDLIPTPLFTRMVPPPWWSYPVWILTAALAGLLLATYTRSDDGRAGKGLLGGALSVLALGCPTCNALVVTALGTSGATSLFAPVQPVLALGSVVLLGYALRTRLRTANSCAVS